MTFQELTREKQEAIKDDYNQRNSENKSLDEIADLYKDCFFIYSGREGANV